MYRYVEDKGFLRRAQASCTEDLRMLVSELLEEGISSQIILVGSGARNMVTQNENGDIDFDYNLLIQKCADINDCRALKEAARKAYNKVMRRQNLNDVQDSTSSLTTGKMYFDDHPNFGFSVDLCIVARGDRGEYYRLIHEKTGFASSDRYYWNEAPHSAELAEKVSALKSNGLWEEVRQCYLEKKNLYLRRNDHNHPSFICYIEAVNEVYSRYRWN